MMDSTGVGDPIFEDVSTEMPWLDGFKFTSDSKQKLIEGLQMAIHDGDITYNEETADELKLFEYTLSSGRRIKYEARTGFHDDCVVALALAHKSRIDNKHFGHYSVTAI